MPALSKMQHVHHAKRRRLLTLVPRAMFSSPERKSEFAHFAGLAGAWKALARKGAGVDFTLLSAKHTLERVSGVTSLQRNHSLGHLTGMDIDSAQVPSAQGHVQANFVESSGYSREQLGEFLFENAAAFSIPSEGWHNWPTTRWLVADSLAMWETGRELFKHGKFNGVLAVGWPTFDAALRLSKAFSVPAFFNFAVPSKLEADVNNSTAPQAIIAREMAALKHGEGILSFDVSHLQSLLRDYDWGAVAGAKSADFENVLEVLQLVCDSDALSKLLSLPQAIPSDRRHAISFLKQVNQGLDGHPVSQGKCFVVSRHAAAFNPPLGLQIASAKEISAARRKIATLPSLNGPSLSSVKANRVYSVVFSDATDAFLGKLAKAVSIVPDAAILVKSDSPTLLSRLQGACEQFGSDARIAALPEKGETAFLAASQAIIYPNAAGSLLHYEDAVSAISSCRQAGLAEPSIVATKAVPSLLKDAIIFSPAAEPEALSELFKPTAQASAQSKMRLDLGEPWDWNAAATKLVEFLAQRL